MVLRLSDHGPGIAREKLQTLFVAFRRGKVNGQAGVGLGRSGFWRGRRRLESEAGSGSNFSLTLPAKPGSRNKTAGPA